MAYNVLNEHNGWRIMKKILMKTKTDLLENSSHANPFHLLQMDTIYLITSATLMLCVTAAMPFEMTSLRIASLTDLP